jgi:hypothetical protein
MIGDDDNINDHFVTELHAVLEFEKFHKFE